MGKPFCLREGFCILRRNAVLKKFGDGQTQLVDKAGLLQNAVEIGNIVLFRQKDFSQCHCLADIPQREAIADSLFGEHPMRQTTEAEHLGGEDGVLSGCGNQISFRLRGELLGHNENLPFRSRIRLMDDFLYAEVGFACAGSADDETQSHFYPFFLICFFLYDTKGTAFFQGMTA